MGPTSKGGEGRGGEEGEGKRWRRKGFGPRKKFLVPPLQITQEIVS